MIKRVRYIAHAQTPPQRVRGCVCVFELLWFSPTRAWPCVDSLRLTHRQTHATLYIPVCALTHRQPNATFEHLRSNAFVGMFRI
jgi:hypothetical protein